MADNTPNLGHEPTPDAARDAIHVAVAPVVAGEHLDHGDHVGQLPDGTFGRNAKQKLGIVDPYQTVSIRKGERFWLFLYPNTVTGMRHHWQHPAFTDNPHPADRDSKEFSEAWLRQYAVRMNIYESPGEAFETLVKGLKSGELFAHGTDLHYFGDLDDPEELKEHAERYLGIKIDWGRYSFHCSC